MENVKSNLKRHMDELHKDIRNHVCKKCGLIASIRKGSLEEVHENKMSHVQSFLGSHGLLQCVSSPLSDAAYPLSSHTFSHDVH